MKSTITPLSIKSQVGCLLLLTLLPLIVYFNSLKGAFLYDDVPLIEQPWISDITHYQDEVSFFPHSSAALPLLNTRPALLFTFALNNTLHPRRVLGFHLVNLLLHVLVTVLVFVLVRLSQECLYSSRLGLAEPRYQEGGGCRSPTLPLIVALFFALHPLATDSVSYISSRSTLLATFFYLSGLYAFLRIFTLETSPYRWALRTFLAAAIVVLYYFALASKLITATLPVLLGVWFVFIISPKRFPRLQALLLSGKVLALYALALLVLLKMVLGFRPLDQGLNLYGQTGYFLAQLKVIVFYYLKVFLFPVNQNVDIGFPFTGTGIDPQIFLAITVLVGILTWVLLKGGPFLKAGTAWFFLALAPTSSFLPLNDLAVEHRMYLPMSLGLCLIAGVWVFKIAQPRRLLVLLVLLLTAGVLTTNRNRVWLNEMTLWQDAMAKSPLSPRPHNNVGKAYYERGKKDRAIEFLRKSIDLFDGFPPAHYNLGNVYMDFDRLQEAEEEYKIAIRLDPKYFVAYLGLGSIYNQTGRYEEAIKNYNHSNDEWKTQRQGDYALAKLNLGEVYGKLGRFEEAIKESKLALKSSPSMFKAYFNLGAAYMKLGDLANAERSFLACLDTNSQFEQAQFNLAHLYQVKKEWRKSNQWFEKFLQTKGPQAKAYFGIAWNHQQSAQWDMARSFYEKSLAAKPDYLNARLNLANVYIQLKQFDQALNHLAQALEQQPKQFRLHMQMGLIYWKAKNDKIRAENHFKKAFDLAPQDQEKKQVSQLIRALSQS